MIRLALSLRSWKEATVLREQSENAEAKITAVPVKAQLLNECESDAAKRRQLPPLFLRPFPSTHVSSHMNRLRTSIQVQRRWVVCT